MKEFKEDVLGNKLGKDYSMILTDPTFERRLKAFDPNLKLLFDQNKKKWTILEYERDNTGKWRILLRSEDDVTKKPIPVGDWIFERLLEFRNMYEHNAINSDQHFRDLTYKADMQMVELETKSSINHMHQLLDDRNEWRRAARELKNFPKSDVTAGYPKNPYTKEVITNDSTKDTTNTDRENGTSI